MEISCFKEGMLEAGGFWLRWLMPIETRMFLVDSRAENFEMIVVMAVVGSSTVTCN